MLKKLTSFISRQSRISEIIRFCIVGGFATLLQYGIYVIFVDAVGVKAVASTIISYAISFIANYILTTLFTFRKKPSSSNILGFIGCHAINMGLQTGLVAIFKGITGDTLALLPALAICVPINYLMVRFVFMKNQSNIQHDKQNSDSI